MKILLFFVLALALSFDEVDGILQLDKSNFKEAVDTIPYLVVKFWIDGCQHCEKMKPAFIELKHRMEGLGYTFAEVNSDQNKVLTAKQKVHSYPSLRLYAHGRMVEVPGESESVQLLKEYITQNTYQLVTPLKTEEEVKLFIKRNPIAVIARQDSLIADLAIANLKVKFATFNDNSMIDHNYELYTRHAEVLKAKLEVDQLQNWIDVNGYPLVFSFNEEDYTFAEKERKPLMVIHTAVEYTERLLDNIAEQYPQYRFVLIKTDDQLAPRRFKHVTKMDLQLEHLHFYNYQTKESNILKIESFEINVVKVLINTIADYSIPFKNEGKPIELSQSHWNPQVITSDKHVLVYFYATWCGHCAQFTPIYNDLARVLLAHQDIIVTKINFPEKNIPGVTTEGYPTIRLYKKTDGITLPITYTGERTLIGLIDFIDLHLPRAKPVPTITFPESTITELTPDNFEELAWNSKKHTFIFFYAPHCVHSLEMNPEWELLADFYKDHESVLITRANAWKIHYPRFAINEFPLIYLLKKGGSEPLYIKYESADRKFALFKSFLEEKLELNTQPQVAKGVVVQATSDNFEELVLKSKEAVFVKFFAPWCGHCKNMQPDYEELATKFADNQNVIIAEMDWTQHKTSHVEIKGFPTLVLFTKKNGEVQQVKYQKGRIATAMYEFIIENIEERREDL